MCGPDSLSNWFAVVYMSIKAFYSGPLRDTLCKCCML